MTQDELAKKLGVKKRTYAAWERGENKLSLENAIHIADILEISLDNMCDRINYYSVLDQVKDSTLRSLLINYSKLNEKGKKELLNYSSAISYNPDYK